MYEESSTKEAIDAFNLAIYGFKEQGRCGIAAKCYSAVGKIYEKDRNIVAAMEAFQNAADLYQAEDNMVHRNELLLKIAFFSAERQEWKKAIEIFEEISKIGMAPSRHNSQFQVPGYLSRASILQLVLACKSDTRSMDVVREALLRYGRLCPAFDRNKDMELAKNLLQDCEDMNIKKFTDHIYQYDKIHHLDDWTAKMLLEVKNSLKAEPILLADTDDSSELKGPSLRLDEQSPSENIDFQDDDKKKAGSTTTTASLPASATTSASSVGSGDATVDTSLDFT